MADTVRKPRAAKEKTDTVGTINRDELLAMLKNDLELLNSIREAVMPETKAVELSSTDEDKVTVTCFYNLTGGGQIFVKYGNGKNCEFNTYGQQIKLSPDEFEQFATSPVAKELFRARILVAEGSGISDLARAAGKLDYKNGELVSKDFVHRVFDTDFEKVLSLIPKLCEAHIALIASAYNEAVKGGGNKVSRDKLFKLNDASKQATGKEIFGNIIKLYNEINGENSI